MAFIIQRVDRALFVLRFQCCSKYAPLTISLIKRKFGFFSLQEPARLQTMKTYDRYFGHCTLYLPWSPIFIVVDYSTLSCNRRKILYWLWKQYWASHPPYMKLSTISWFFIAQTLLLVNKFGGNESIKFPKVMLLPEPMTANILVPTFLFSPLSSSVLKLQNFEIIISFHSFKNRRLKKERLELHLVMIFESIYYNELISFAFKCATCGL